MDLDLTGPEGQDRYVANISIADARHDFGADGPVLENATRVGIFNESIPRAANDDDPYGEARSLNVLLNSGDESWNAFLSRNSKDRPFPLTIGGVQYNIKSFKIEDREDVFLEASELAENRIGLSLRGAALVVDMSHHKLFARLKHGAASAIPIYYLTTPEAMNDPAGKTSHGDDVFNQAGGLNIIPCVEVRNSPIVFSGGEHFDKSRGPRTLFYTNYTTMLSPIHGVQLPVAAGAGVPAPIGVIPDRLNVTLTVKSNAHNYTLIVENSKANNSINQVKKFLNKIYQTLLNYVFGNNPKKEFDIASAWLQKRSGDWLQAISARDISGRSFLDGRTGAPIVVPPETPVYFVTHDRIACAYALMIGCNVIFLSARTTDDFFVFSRRDEQAAPFNYPIEERVLRAQKETINAKIVAATATLEQLKNIQFVLNPEKDGIALSRDAANIFTMMIKRTYASECLEKYNQLLNGMNSPDTATKYTSLQYSQLDRGDFVGDSIMEKPIGIIASNWVYTSGKPRALKGPSTKPAEYYDFLVYVGTLPDVVLKKKMMEAFRTLAEKLKKKKDNLGRLEWRKERLYEGMYVGFQHISDLIDTYVGVGLVPADKYEEEGVRILSSLSIDLVDLVGFIDPVGLHGTEEEQVAQILRMFHDQAYAEADSLELLPAVFRQALPAAAPAAVPAAVPAALAEATALGKRRGEDQGDGDAEMEGEDDYFNIGDSDEDEQRAAVMKNKKPRRRGADVGGMKGGEKESFDIVISHVDRIMPIIRRLNTLQLKSTINTESNYAFLLSPILAIVYGLEGTIEKLEGSPDLAMYGRYVALLKHMSNMITTNEHRQLVWEFLTSDPKYREQIAALFGISKEDYLLTGMISFGISQFLFGNVPGEPTAITALKPGSLKEMWEASKQGIAMNYEQIVKEYETLRKDTFSRISKSVIEYPSPPAAPAVQATARNVPTTPPPVPTAEPTTPPREIQSAQTPIVQQSPTKKKPTAEAKIAPWDTRKRPSIRYRQQRTIHRRFAMPYSTLVRTGGGRKTYRKKPKRSKLSQRTRRVRRPGLSKEFETQVSQ